MTDVEGKIAVPGIWRGLVMVDFPEDLEGISKARHSRDRSAIGDPRPYYDDHREVATELPDGSEFELFLASGQGNYWAHFRIDGPNGYLESEPFHGFYDKREEFFSTPDETSYCVKYDWTGPAGASWLEDSWIRDMIEHGFVLDTAESHEGCVAFSRFEDGQYSFFHFDREEGYYAHGVPVVGRGYRENEDRTGHAVEVNVDMTEVNSPGLREQLSTL
jgi:hypothetical protein